MTRLKERIRYAAAALAVMALGFCSREFAERLPAFFAEHAGDALWAAMVYFIVRTLFARKGLIWSGHVSVIFCFGIEFSQLYQAEWIAGIRSTRLGALVLGTGFVAIDLARYAAGIGLAMLADKWPSGRLQTRA
ncbi:ribosomal maturation YjgA family protein [Paenibacillus arenilitoris]|uniref:ribosomal maturation YjgA family protein n=1 Tax=Paenibacillus arenilitoris TaxID=2772299 RepID=UPI00295C0080|nr:DUF2809 domain-containing protein [Paenibacillus arenilitoris]